MIFSYDNNAVVEFSVSVPEEHWQGKFINLVMLIRPRIDVCFNQTITFYGVTPQDIDNMIVELTKVKIKLIEQSQN